MALKSPVPPSPTGLSSFLDSPTSPITRGVPSQMQTQRSSGHSQTDSLAPPPSPYPQFTDPSPVDSNGTSIEDDGRDDSQEKSPLPVEAENGDDTLEKVVTEVLPAGNEHVDAKSPADSVSPIGLSPMSSAGSPTSRFNSIPIDTSIGARLRSDSEGAPVSVIHVPTDFGQFDRRDARPGLRVAPSSSAKSDNTVISPVSPDTPEAQRGPTAPLKTLNLPPPKPFERPTPQAQTRQEADEATRERLEAASLLADIPEGLDGESPREEVENGSPRHEAREHSQDSGSTVLSRVEDHEAEAQQLTVALENAWVLCNSLAELSSSSTTTRSRAFGFRDKPFGQEPAWNSCWRICQRLYETRDEDFSTHILSTLEMCKDFCNTLFDVRQRHNDVADSVLRVSFELNNHLYNVHERSLPLAFQERTLEFYLTLCHRLMKQPTSLPLETEALVRACWTLSEILFSIRQNRGVGKVEEEELLSSAVQACWDLCGLFKDCWAHARPERSTPKPPQSSRSETTSYHSHAAHTARSSTPSIARSSSSRSYRDAPSTQQDPNPPPETPTTIFDDINDSMDSEDEIPVPNILVLGPESSSSANSHHRWKSSSASAAYSDASSARSSTTAGTTSPSQTSEINLHRIRALLVQAATNLGFQPRSLPPTSSSASASARHSQQQSQAFANFVKALPSNSFGSLPWQTTTLSKYRRLVLNWPGANRPTIIPATPRRVVAADVARAVMWMQHSERYTWLRDLFRVVFGCLPDDEGLLAGQVVVA